MITHKVQENNKGLKWDYFFVLLLICYSGNPFFIFSPFVREAHIILTIIFAFLIFKRGKFDIYLKYILFVLPIFVIMLLHMAMFVEASISTNLFMLMKMFIGVSVVCMVGKRFIYAYVNTIVVLTVISLICWIYNIIFGLIPGGVAVTEICNSIVVYTQDIYRVQDASLRNTGMFWEPGAHQGFLNLALVFLMRLDDINKRRFKAIVLVLGVLSTQSTTGYIVLMLVSLMYVLEKEKVSGSRKSLLFVVFLFASYFIYTEVSFLGDKIEDNLSDTSSSQGRVTDFIKYKQLIEEHPLMGNSYNSKVVSGNGFFYQIVSIGFIGTLYLLVFLYKKVLKGTTPLFATLFLATIIVMYNGEVFVTMPFFMALPFIEFPKQSKNKIILV